MIASPPGIDPPALGTSPEVLGYLQHLRVQRRLAERSLVLYQQALARLGQCMALERLGLSDVRPLHVRGWVGKLHAQGLGASSIAIHLAAWRGLYRWLVRQGQASLNPVDGIRAPKAGKPLPKALSVDHAVALADTSAHAASCPAPQDTAQTDKRRQAREAPWLAARDHCMVELLYSSGLRISELTSLQASAHSQAQGWIDLDAAQAHVLGKGGKRRQVPVGKAALQALRNWLPLRAQAAASGETALFINRLGTRLSAAQCRNRLGQVAQQAGLPTHVHPHMLRHSFASHLLQSSGDLRGVQELLGHAHISSTQIYTRLDFQHLAKAYDDAHPRAHSQPQPQATQPQGADKPGKHSA